MSVTWMHHLSLGRTEGVESSWNELSHSFRAVHPLRDTKAWALCFGTSTALCPRPCTTAPTTWANNNLSPTPLCLGEGSKIADFIPPGIPAVLTLSLIRQFLGEASLLALGMGLDLWLCTSWHGGFYWGSGKERSAQRTLPCTSWRENTRKLDNVLVKCSFNAVSYKGEEHTTGFSRL